MIEIRGLSKSFGPMSALRGIDLQVADGQFLTIVGPNGAGKTTLLRILATLLKPSRGDVYINGLPLTAENPEMRRQIGYLSDRPLIYPHLTAEENLFFFGRLYDVSPLRERVDSLLQAVGLVDRRHSMAGTLSRGLQQRLSLARSMIHQPAIMLLDEPFTGLDPQATQMLEGLLQRLRPKSQTVIMTIHNLEQGLALCDRLVILARGAVAYQTDKTSLTLSDLRETYWHHTQGAS